MSDRQAVPTMSEEAQLARQIEALIAKIVAGKATDEDVMLYEMLTKRRVDLMFVPDSRREKVN